MVVTERMDLNLYLSKPPLPAAVPPEQRGVSRDAVKLLILDKQTGRTTHTHFYQLPKFLTAGDVVVVNTSMTIPGKLSASFRGVPLEIHLATKLSDQTYIVERRTAIGGPDPTEFRPGDVVDIVEPASGKVAAQVEVTRHFHPKSRLWVVMTRTDLFALAPHIGRPIRYDYVQGEYGSSAYQSIFSRTYGSAEMPSAARPFTHRVLKELAAWGVTIRSLVLHTGVSSHEVESDLSSHPVLPEWYEIPRATADAVNLARSQGRRVIAVGTTVVRALESAAQVDNRVKNGTNWTTHLVTPDTPPRITTGLVTGMHENQSSHLAMLYGFVRPEFLRAAYQEAVDRDYLWHEFGDTNLII